MFQFLSVFEREAAGTSKGKRVAKGFLQINEFISMESVNSINIKINLIYFTKIIYLNFKNISIYHKSN